MDDTCHESRQAENDTTFSTANVAKLAGSTRWLAMVLPCEIYPRVEIAGMPKKLVGGEPTRLRDTLFPGTLGHLELRPSDHGWLAAIVNEPPELGAEDYSAKALEGREDLHHLRRRPAELIAHWPRRPQQEPKRVLNHQCLNPGPPTWTTWPVALSRTTD